MGEVDKNLLIIKLVEQKICLYNKSVHCYKDNVQKKKACKFITAELFKITGIKVDGMYSQNFN